MPFKGDIPRIHGCTVTYIAIAFKDRFYMCLIAEVRCDTIGCRINYFLYIIVACG
jgi:hypothetical protein